MLVFYNPEAGPKTEKIARDLQQEYDYHDFRRIKSTPSFQTKLEDGLGKIAIIGGDGTISDAVQVLADVDTVLGIIPTGYANDFAKALNIPEQPHEALRVAEEGCLQEIDLGQVGEDYFCNTFGFGFDARVAQKSFFNRGYKKNMLKEIFTWDSVEVEAEITNTSETWNLNSQVIMATFSNGLTEGGGFHVNQGENVLSDGKLGLTVIYDLSLPERLLDAPFFFTDSFAKAKKVDFEKIYRANFRSQRAIFHKDGDIYNPDPEKEELYIQVCPKCLDVVVPWD